jgi:peptide/nickel transport system substrate-binding protein
MGEDADPVKREGNRALTREELLRRAAAGGAALLVGGGLADVADAAVRVAAPKRGGTFRLGVAGGSARDFIDGHTVVARPEQARITTAWETLVEFDPSFRLEFTGLAEEINASSASVWTIRVRDGIEFSNGKTLGADDVIYSIRRLIDPKLGLAGGAALTSVDPDAMQKLDKRTVRLTLKRPDVSILDALGQYFAGIVPVGYSPHAVGKAHPNVGTGPYVLESFTPGHQSVHTRNPNYWRTGQPYFDEVVIIDFPDATARVNALLGGQIDAITDVPSAQVAAVNGHSGTRVLESPSAFWAPISMRVDAAPFTDVRVRQAMRLIADRPEMVAQALAGHGRIGNDICAPFDPVYDHALPQRHQDLDHARSLLKAAGHSGLKIDLQSTDAGLGMNEGAEVFAQQAKAAGVTVNVTILDVGSFLSNYLKWPFSMTYFGTRNYLSQVAVGSLPTSSNNETHWPDKANERFIALYREALGTVDTTQRTAIIHQMQTMEYHHGGYIIWGFSDLLDGYSTKVQGLKTGDKGVLPLNGFARGFRTIWFD